MSDTISSRVKATIRDIPDFPTPGIMFKDITPVLADPALMTDVIAAMSEPYVDARVTHVVAMESRGFLFGMPIALRLQAAFAPARKPGKLPWRIEREAYELEYRTDVLEMHADALGPGSRVLLVDDVLATGGTALAASRLVARLGGAVVGLSVLCELAFLGGRDRLPGLPIRAIAPY